MATSAPSNSGTSPFTVPPCGTWCTVGGRRLFVHRSGSGAPGVVFLPGGGAVGLDYWNVQARVAESATTLAYDRSGTGWSDPVALPRTAGQVTDELRALLDIAEIPSPRVLVGHSLGGLYARHFAQRFPNEVSALVLLDPAHEDYDAYMPAALNALRRVRDPNAPMRWRDTQSALTRRLTARCIDAVLAVTLAHVASRSLLLRLPVVARARALYRELFGDSMAEWPANLRNPLIEAHLSPEWLWASMREVRNVEVLYDELRRSGPLPDVPIVVLAANAVDAFRAAVSVGETDALLREEIAAKRRLYLALAASVTDGEVRDIDAGHVTLHFRHPEAVVQAICDVAAKAK